MPVQITTKTGAVVTVQFGYGPGATNKGGYFCRKDGHQRNNACGVCGTLPSDRCVCLTEAYHDTWDLPLCHRCIPEILLLDEVVNG